MQKVRRKRGGAEGAVHELYIQPTIRGALPYLWAESPHSLARIVSRLLMNAATVYLILNDLVLSRQHCPSPWSPATSHTSTIKTDCNCRGSVITHLWAPFMFHDNETQQDVSIAWGSRQGSARTRWASQQLSLNHVRFSRLIIYCIYPFCTAVNNVMLTDMWKQDQEIK